MGTLVACRRNSPKEKPHKEKHHVLHVKFGRMSSEILLRKKHTRVNKFMN
jgi:hypothetical protein